MNYTAFIGTNSVRGSRGIYTLSISDSGDMQILSSCQAQNSGFLAVSRDQNHLYAVRENMIFQGNASGGLGSYRILENGKLEYQNQVPVSGQLPCYVSTDDKGRYVFVSSYLNGCISIHKILEDGAVSPAVKTLQHETRFQTSPSMHCVSVTPDQKYLAGIDVSQHRLTFYDLEQETFDVVYELQLPGPYNTDRPRQIAFSADHAYVILEIGHGVISFRYQPECPDCLLVREQDFDLQPPGYEGMTTGAGIRLSPTGRVLACTLRRAHYGITFKVSADGTLSQMTHYKLKGNTPRDLGFTPDGRYLLVLMQRSDSVELYKVVEETAGLSFISELHGIPDGTCVVFGKEDAPWNRPVTD